MAIDVQLDPAPGRELPAEGAALTQYEAVAYALDATARALVIMGAPESVTGR